MAYVGEERLRIREVLLALDRTHKREDILAEFEEYRKRVKQFEVINGIKRAVSQRPYENLTEMIRDQKENWVK